MIVSNENFAEVVEKLSQPGQYGLDTETFGVDFDDRLFSIIISDNTDSFYFNFLEKPDHLGRTPPPEFCLPRESSLLALGGALSRVDSLWFIHNAKFDLQKLRLEGIEINGRVHCTMATERLIYNHYLDHSLDACARRRGLEKDKTVEEYIKKFNLYEVKNGEKKPRFDLVPFFIMSTYGQQDGRLAYQIGIDQRRELDLTR